MHNIYNKIKLIAKLKAKESIVDIITTKNYEMRKFYDSESDEENNQNKKISLGVDKRKEARIKKDDTFRVQN
jgi:hypothetical protein